MKKYGAHSPGGYSLLAALNTSVNPVRSTALVGAIVLLFIISLFKKK